MTTRLLGVDETVRSHMRVVLTVAATAILLALVLGWLAADTRAFSGLLAALAWPVVVIVLAVSAVMLWRDGWSIGRDPALPASDARLARWAVPAVTLLLAVTLPAGREQLMQMHLRQELAQDRPAFERIVARATGANPTYPAVRGHEGRTISFDVDRGPPTRVMFVRMQMGDNGNGFVWDPTDAVLAARGRENGQLTAPDEVRELFGGDLIRCRRVRDHFHHCGFT